MPFIIHEQNRYRKKPYLQSSYSFAVSKISITNLLMRRTNNKAASLLYTYKVPQ